MPPFFRPTKSPQAPSPDDLRLQNKGASFEALQPVSTPYSNRYFSIRDRAGYFTVEYESHDVVVIPVVEGREFVMVRPFRPVLGDAPLEFPGGGGDAGELPVETAARELFEEVGLKIADLSRFKSRTPFCLSPNRMPRLHHVFEIQISGQEAACLSPDNEEIFSVERLSLKQARELIASGTIYVAAVAGLMASLLFSIEARQSAKV